LLPAKSVMLIPLSQPPPEITPGIPGLNHSMQALADVLQKAPGPARVGSRTHKIKSRKACSPKGVKLLYWRIPPGYPRPFPGEPWFVGPAWPYRWRRPKTGKEKDPAQLEGDGIVSAPVEAPAEEKPAPDAETVAASPGPPPGSPPAGREVTPVPAAEEKKEDAVSGGTAAGPLKWHFPR